MLIIIIDRLSGRGRWPDQGNTVFPPPPDGGPTGFAVPAFGVPAFDAPPIADAAAPTFGGAPPAYVAAPKFGGAPPAAVAAPKFGGAPPAAVAAPTFGGAPPAALAAATFGGAPPAAVSLPAFVRPAVPAKTFQERLAAAKRAKQCPAKPQPQPAAVPLNPSEPPTQLAPTGPLIKAAPKKAGAAVRFPGVRKQDLTIIEYCHLVLCGRHGQLPIKNNIEELCHLQRQDLRSWERQQLRRRLPSQRQRQLPSSHRMHRRRKDIC